MTETSDGDSADAAAVLPVAEDPCCGWGLKLLLHCSSELTSRASFVGLLALARTGHSVVATAVSVSVPRSPRELLTINGISVDSDLLCTPAVHLRSVS
jgi:hypothetical protein